MIFWSILCQNVGRFAAAAYGCRQDRQRELENLPDGEALVICGSLYLASLFAGGMEGIAL